MILVKEVIGQIPLYLT